MGKKGNSLDKWVRSFHAKIRFIWIEQRSKMELRPHFVETAILYQELC